MNSIWQDNVKLPVFPKLEGDVKTDVLIIGGGMAGILCAYMLDKEGVDYILVEAEKICGKITCNTTAKITSQHGWIYSKLIKEFGKEIAEGYLKANEEAVEGFRQMCRNIDCDFDEKDSFVYSINNLGKLEEELNALDLIGYRAEYVRKLPMPFETDGAICFRNQGQFHPLKFIKEISKNLCLYENTKICELGEGFAKTESGVIKASNIIIATHFPMNNKHGGYFIKLYQSRSYVLALENGPNYDGMYINESGKGFSFRNYKEFLLLGGGSHRTGKTSNGWKELEDFAKKNYPGASIKYRFAAQDCMSLDGIPYVGSYGKKTKGLYVATGYNKWGMTSSLVSSKILTNLIMDRNSPYLDIFSPQRTIMRKQIYINMEESIKNFILLGEKRCPHLGCTLKWNKVEHSWDCPCHGSRFTGEGKVIDNPATSDL